MQGWNIYYRGYWIETVFYDADMDAETVKRSLVNHDGFDPSITIERYTPMKTTKIQVSPEVREFNDAVEHADMLLDYRHDRCSALLLIAHLQAEKTYPAAVEWLASATAGISVKR